MTHWKEAKKSEHQGDWGGCFIFILLLILGLGLASGGNDSDTGQGCEKPWYSSTTYCK